MIDLKFIEQDPNPDNFSLIELSNYPVLFLGFNIKNEYDNRRIQLNKEFKPVNIVHPLGANKDQGVYLKGLILKPNNTIKQLFSSIATQEKLTINVVIYENLLNQYNLACKETYSYFAKGLYPVDFNNLKSICEDDFNTDKKIFQHLLNLDEKIFDFQKFSSLKLFMLTV